MPLSAGDRLGGHKILAPLGAGSMGEVHRERDLELERDFAINVLPEKAAGHADRLARFGREAGLLASPTIIVIAETDEFRIGKKQ